MVVSLVALLTGVLFGLGLTLSGMTSPHKVIGFLDFFGNWDPALAFVMVGAIGVKAIAMVFIRTLRTPIFAEKFQFPTKRDIDKKLVVGSALFGIGWGLAGFCPGPALTSLVTGSLSVILFVAAMALGMLLQARLAKS